MPESTDLRGPLGEGGGLVRVVPSDLVDLVGKVSEEETLTGEQS